MKKLARALRRRARRAAQALRPESLFARFFWMIAAPMLATQGLAVYVFYTKHWDSVTRHVLEAAAGEADMLADLARVRPEEADYWLAAADARLYMTARRVPPGAPVPEGTAEIAAPGRAAEALRAALRFNSAASAPVRLAARFPDGGAVYIEIPRKRLASPTAYIFILWLTGAGFLTAFASLLFMKNQVRAAAKLAAAMRRFGAGDENAPFKPAGAREIRQMGEAFVRMRRRILRFVRGRTAMLTGISHDLKTPITRVKLQAALLPEGSGAEEINRDLDEMRELIDSYLNYLRGEANDPHLPGLGADTGAALRRLAERYRACGADVLCETEEHLPPAPLSEASLRRLLENCAENAFRYGGGKILFTASRLKGGVQIRIEDNGEGVPEGLSERVFLPFFRGKREGKPDGSGLGLAIARDIVKRGGGAIRIVRGEALGGASCVIFLPSAWEDG